MFFFFKFDRFFFNSCGRVDRHWWQRDDWGLWLVHHYRGRLGGPPDPYTLNTDAHLVQETQVWRIGKISHTIYFDEGAFQNLFENKNYENFVFLSFFNRTMPLQNRSFRTMLLTNPVEKARLSWFVFFALFWIEELPVYIYTDLWLGDSFNRSNILYFKLCLSYRNLTWRIFRGVYFQVMNSPDNVFSWALI